MELNITLDLTGDQYAGLEAATAARNADLEAAATEEAPFTPLSPEDYVAFVMHSACDSYFNNLVKGK